MINPKNKVNLIFIRNSFGLLLSIIVSLSISIKQSNALPHEWVGVPKSKFGEQLWDRQSIKRNEDGSVRVLSKFIRKIMNKIQKFLSVVFFIAIFVVLIYLIQNYGIEPLRNKIESMGIWAPFGIFILRGLSIILPALPSSAYSLLAGSLLGFQKGYMTIIFSDIVFCQVAFFIARNYGRVPVRNLVGPKAMKKIESFNQNQLEENFFLMTGLLMTGLFDFLSYAIGIGGTRWKIFTPALLISLLISDSILVAVGAGVSQGAGLFLGVALLGMFALATISGLAKNKIPK